MKPTKIDIGGQLQAVRLLKPVRAGNGQEFQAGWVAGFSAETAAMLINSGCAVALAPPATPKAKESESPPKAPEERPKMRRTDVEESPAKAVVRPEARFIPPGMAPKKG
jgi:hypothetical protein